MTNRPHHDEEQRLATLAKLQILGGADEPALDRLAQTAAKIFDVPMCAVSLITENEELYRARCGIDAVSGPRHHAFCAHTIQSDQVMVVPDALGDDRFRQNPSVTAPDGVRFYAGAPIVAPDGSRIGAFCVKDRTPRQFAERDIEILRSFAAMAMSEIMHRLSTRESESASRAKSCFLAGMNHGVRSPLTSIVGYAELLIEPGLSAAEREDAVHCIRRSGQQLIEFVDDAVLLAELECGGVMARPRDFVLCDLVRDVEANIGGVARAKNLQFDISTMIDVPHILNSDPVLLRQTLTQLLSNAIKYTDSGSVSLHIRKAPTDGRVCFEVCDTGRGISREQLTGLFDSSARAQLGAAWNFGIGMPIVTRLASLMQGRIRAQSTEGIGSIFTLEIKAFETDAGGDTGSGMGEDRPADIREAA